LGASEAFPSAGAGRRCPNCGARLTGRFCAGCGQAAQPTDDLFDLLREWLARVFGSESILWSTLGRLVVAPGGLTRDWWAGRRARIMSPVRTLLVVLLGGAVVATLEHLFVGRAEVDVGRLLAVFTYQLAGVGLLVALRLLPRLLPADRQRTPYEIATFALYEGAFLGLLTGTGYLVLIVSSLLPPIMAAPFVGLAALVIPGAAALVLGHAVLHLKSAFGLGWAGSVGRILALVVPIWVSMLLVTVILAATGLDRFWAPTVPDGEFGTFQRVPTANP